MSLVQDPGIRADSAKGAAVHAAAMCDAFTKCGVEVMALFSKNNADTLAQLREHQSAGIDFVYERYSLGAYAGSEWAKSQGIPHVLEVNSPLEWEATRWRSGLPESFDGERERRMFMDSHLVSCVSDPVAQYAIERGAQVHATLVLPNGVDTERFQPLPAAARDKAKRDWFPSLESPVVLGFHGRLRPWHNWQRIAQAAGACIERGVNLAVCCVGRGDFQEALAQGVPQDRFHWIDWCSSDELAQHVGCFDLMALGYDASMPYYFSPLKLREAMCAGVVPIVPDIGSLPKEVGHGRCGLIYDPTAAEGLAWSIETLCGSQEIRNVLSREARQLARKCDWKNIAHRVLDGVGAVRP
ncbi:MAG: glycosyltransferase family 4 protein [Planctomycetes bacterium]|nr:glycosyltransferase family 4 protein [Planctomycetota bacterium]